LSAIQDLPILGDMHRTLPLSQVQAKLSELVEAVITENERITVTVDGRPAVVLVSVDELEALDETAAESANKAHEQSLAIANSPHEPSDQAFVDSVSADWETE
jgi:antitoxin YefM